MDSQEFYSVKVEKANAIARYNRLRRISKILQILEVLVVLTLLSWSSTSLLAAVKISGKYLLESSIYYLSSSHTVFVIGNAIVVALFLIARQNNPGINYSGCAGGDIYDEYVRNSSEAQAQYRVGSSVSEGDSSPSPTAVEKAEVETESGKEMALTEAGIFEEQYDAMTSAIEKAKKQIQKFQRTQSEKLKREIKVKPRRELRRSESEMLRIVVSSGSTGRLKTTAFDTVDSLSNEEFKLTIERFIAKHQSFFKEQKMAEDDISK